jgi:hypothetical protein
MPNPRSLPIAIDPRSFNMTASSGNCDANNPRRQVSLENGIRLAPRSGNLARSPLRWPTDISPTRRGHRVPDRHVRRWPRQPGIPNRVIVFELDQVVPWGRSFDEYVRMFALSDEDLGRTIWVAGTAGQQLGAV